jgi:hypothetical protein
MKMEIGNAVTQKLGTEFVEVLSGSDKDQTSEGILADELKNL